MNIFLIIAAVVFCITLFLLFRRIKPKTNCRKNDLNVLKEIVKDLPEKYANIAKQAEGGLWQESIPVGGKTGLYTLIVQFANTQEEHSYYDKRFPHYLVLGPIHAKSRKTGSQAEVELHLNRGVLIQYRTTIPLNELDISTVNYSDLGEQILHENAPESSLSQKLAELFRDASPELLAKLEISDSYEIELEEGIFYPIKQYESGNILALNNDAAIFLLSHDPYEVRKLYPSPAEFLAACNNSIIDPEDEESLLAVANPTSWR